MAALLSEAQPGYPGAVDGGDRVGDGVQRGGSGDRIVVQSLNAKQAPVGGKADLPQGGQINQTFPDAEIMRVVDRGLGP